MFLCEPFAVAASPRVRLPSTKAGDSDNFSYADWRKYEANGADLHDAQHSEVSQDHLQWIAQQVPRQVPNT